MVVNHSSTTPLTMAFSRHADFPDSASTFNDIASRWSQYQGLLKARISIVIKQLSDAAGEDWSFNKHHSQYTPLTYCRAILYLSSGSVHAIFCNGVFMPAWIADGRSIVRSRRFLVPKTPLSGVQSACEMTSRKNSYFPRVSGMGEYCVCQTSGLLFKCRCKFSDTGFAAWNYRGVQRRESGIFLRSRYGELCAGGFGLPVLCSGLQTCVQLATFRFAAWGDEFLFLTEELYRDQENHSRSAGSSQSP